MDLFTKYRGSATITRRINTIRQPEGGFLSPNAFTVTAFDGGNGDGGGDLNPPSLNPDLVEAAVYYLSAVMLGRPARSAFMPSLYVSLVTGFGEDTDEVGEMIEGIVGLDRASVVNAVIVCGYIVCHNADVDYCKKVDRIVPDDAAVENIVTMVNRTVEFARRFETGMLGPISLDGGYSNIVTAGAVEMLSKDTVWNFRISVSAADEKDTLRVLMYWRMGLRSTVSAFKDVKYLGIFNPRRNEISRIAVEDIPEEVLFKVDRDVIGYKQRWYECGGAGDRGCSLIERVSRVEQPDGGYLSPILMSYDVLGEGVEGLKGLGKGLSDCDARLSVVASAVFRLAFFVYLGFEDDLFSASLMGATAVGEALRAGTIIEKFSEADFRNEAVVNRDFVLDSLRLGFYDVCHERGAEFYGSGVSGGSVGGDAVAAYLSDDAVEDVTVMVERTLAFLKGYSLVRTHYTFSGGYTDLIRTGDGDFKSRHVLWCFRVSESGVSERDTLELLVCWRMGLHSRDSSFADVRYLGVFNPMLNRVWRIAVTEIPADVIAAVERDVIGYV